MNKESQEKYKGKTYEEILKEIKIPEKDRWEWCRVETEEICNALEIPYYYDVDKYDVTFLYSFESGLNWICTDTLVGLNFLFMEDDDSELFAVGFTEQTGRKCDIEYSFFSESYARLVYNKMVEYVKPEMKNVTIVSKDKVCFS